MNAPTAIVAPLAAELAGVLAATRDRRRLHPLGGRRGPRVTLGSLGGEEVALMATGDGPAAAAAGLEALLAALRPRRLLAVGVAGGLTPGLAEGTLVAARRIVAADGSAPPRQPDAAWLERALACGCIAGLAVSADRIVADPRARQGVLEQALATPAVRAGAAPTVGAGAAPTPAAPQSPPGSAWPPSATVDLESAVYAGLAAAWSLPFLVVRAVLDPAEEELPLDFEACRDRSGRVRNARVVMRALARPASLRRLWRLRARVRGAATRLGMLAEQLVAAVPLRAVAAPEACRAGGAAATEWSATAGGRREGTAILAARR
jgi:nucleoside phosphorylase